MRLTFLGVRGSTPSPGAAFVRVGGNTSCVAVTRDGTHDGAVPMLVLDAGTGLRRLAQVVGTGPFRGSILLSHLHWDHVQGLPFSPPVDRPDARVALWLPEQGDTEAVLARGLSPPHFPIGPEGLRGNWQFHGMEAGRHEVEGFDVLALDVAHKGGRTFGFRISDGSRAFAYVPDHAVPEDDPHGGPEDSALALARGVDVLIHDAQFDDHERAMAIDYGHATVSDAVALAVAAEARTLVLFHHAPDRTDDEITALAERHRHPGLEVIVATEDLVLTLDANGPSVTVGSAPP